MKEVGRIQYVLTQVKSPESSHVLQPYPMYPWHCHILEHEDHDMMRPYEVLQNHDFDPCIPIPGVAR